MKTVQQKLRKITNRKMMYRKCRRQRVIIVFIYRVSTKTSNEIYLRKRKYKIHNSKCCFRGEDTERKWMKQLDLKGIQNMYNRIIVIVKLCKWLQFDPVIMSAHIWENKSILILSYSRQLHYLCKMTEYDNYKQRKMTATMLLTSC